MKSGSYKMVKISLTPTISVHSGQRLYWESYADGLVTTEPSGPFAGWATTQVEAAQRPNWLSRLFRLKGKRVYGTMYFYMRIEGTSVVGDGEKGVRIA